MIVVFLIATLCQGVIGQMGTVCEDVVVSSSSFDPYLNETSCMINGQQIVIAYRTASVKWHDANIAQWACLKGKKRDVS